MCGLLAVAIIDPHKAWSNVFGFIWVLVEIKSKYFKITALGAGTVVTIMLDRCSFAAEWKSGRDFVQLFHAADV